MQHPVFAGKLRFPEKGEGQLTEYGSASSGKGCHAEKGNSFYSSLYRVGIYI